MNFNIITGAPGSGKTEDIFKELVDQAGRFPERSFFVITPEQNTLLTEKRILKAQPGHVLFNIDVLSFNRLAYRIFEDAGIPAPSIIDESGKSMLIRKIVHDSEQDFSIYKSSISKTGFIHKLKTMLSELLMYNISPQELLDIKENDAIAENDMLKAKIDDVYMVLNAFKKAHDENNMTREELLPKAFSYISQTDIFNDAYIIFDGYTGFTSIQYSFITEIARRCNTVIFSLDVPSDENLSGRFEKQELFYMPKDTVKNLEEVAKFIGVKPNLCRHEDKSRQPRAGHLVHLSQNFLRKDVIKYNGENPEQLIFSCVNPVEEARFAAHKINELVHKEGLRYRDIAIVSDDLANTADTIKTVFDKAGIPCYIDTKKDIMGNPLSIFTLAALETVEKSFKYEPVFRFLKSGLSNCSMPEIDELENYAIACGINGPGKWSKGFSRNSYRNHSNLDLEKLNAIREKAISPLLTFRDDYKAAKTISELSSALLKLYDTCMVKEKLESLSEKCVKAEDYVKASEHSQIYGVISGIISELDMLLGEEKVRAKEFKEIIQAGLMEFSVGSLPPSIDEVHVGDIRRSRRGYVKALFLMNFNDGIVPSSGAGNGIFGDDDRELLEQGGIVLAPSSKQTTFDEQFYIYELVSAPTEHLYVSYSRLSLANDSIAPSAYINYITEPFNGLRPAVYKMPGAPDVSNADEALLYLAGHLNNEKYDSERDFQLGLYKVLCEKNHGKEANAVKEAAFFNYEGERLSDKTRAALYSGDIFGSVSRLETQGACAYSHFLSYILSLQERTEYDFTKADRGNYYHKALESAFNNFAALGVSFDELTEEQTVQIVRNAIEEADRQVVTPDLTETGKGQYNLSRWHFVAEKVIRILLFKFKNDDFTPAFRELSFSYKDSPSFNIPLENGQTMKMTGKIDRVDISESPGGESVRIIDYKTYEEKLEKAYIENGIQLQLFTYMNAVLELEKLRNPNKKIYPDSVNYFEVKDILTGVKSPDDDAKEKLAGEYKFTGISEELDRFMEISRQNAKELADDIVRGEISKDPYLYDKKCPCDRCKFRTMCGFDVSLDGYAYRHIRHTEEEKEDE